MFRAGFTESRWRLRSHPGNANLPIGALYLLTIANREIGVPRPRSKGESIARQTGTGVRCAVRNNLKTRRVNNERADK